MLSDPEPHVPWAVLNRTFFAVLSYIVDGVPGEQIKAALACMHIALCARGAFGSLCGIIEAHMMFTSHFTLTAPVSFRKALNS